MIKNNAAVRLFNPCRARFHCWTAHIRHMAHHCVRAKRCTTCATDDSKSILSVFSLMSALLHGKRRLSLMWFN